MTQWELLYNERCVKFLNLNRDEEVVIYKMKSYTYDCLKFHSDWNWIMEVYMKIKECRITLPMNGIEDSITPLLLKRRPIIKAIVDGDKEQLAKAINQFLIWYNEQKTHKQNGEK